MLIVDSLPISIALGVVSAVMCMIEECMIFINGFKTCEIVDMVKFCVWRCLFHIYGRSPQCQVFVTLKAKSVTILTREAGLLNLSEA